jgi:hypothetical protein
MSEPLLDVDEIKRRVMARWPTCKMLVWAWENDPPSRVTVRFPASGYPGHVERVAENNSGQFGRPVAWRCYYGENDTENGQAYREAMCPVEAIVGAVDDERGMAEDVLAETAPFAATPAA